jgi:hypothetical protein
MSFLFVLFSFLMAAKTEYLHPVSALRVVPARNLVALAKRGFEACGINGSKPGGSDDAMNDETICLPSWNLEARQCVARRTL